MGKTNINLEAQLKNHSPCVTNQELSMSSIAQHSWECGHSLDFQNAKTIFNANTFLN